MGLFHPDLEPITRDLSVNAPGLIKVVEVMRRAGVLSGSGPVDTSRYVDASYLADAKALVFATGPFLKTSAETEALFERLFAHVADRAGVAPRTRVFAN